MTRNSRLNSLSGTKNKRLLFKVVKTNWTHNNRPFLDTLYTLFRTAKPKNHTLSTGTYPYNPNKGVLPPGAVTRKPRDQQALDVSVWQGPISGSRVMKKETQFGL